MPMRPSTTAVTGGHGPLGDPYIRFNSSPTFQNPPTHSKSHDHAGNDLAAIPVHIHIMAR